MSTAAGRLWTTQTTTVLIDGEEKVGIAYYILKPNLVGSDVTARVDLQGQFGVANNNLIFPTVAVTKKGKGIISFTLVGHDYYPSSAYTTLDANGVDEIHIVAQGVGPVDGFTGYAAFGDPPLQRFGDYGGAAVQGNNSIWVAGEYMGQTCTLAEWLTNTPDSPLGSCGMTRTGRANWYTRITKLKP